jgi:hypothetical protein
MAADFAGRRDAKVATLIAVHYIINNLALTTFQSTFKLEHSQLLHIYEFQQ